MILVTGGAGFIGSNFVHDWLAHETSSILNLDKLTYAGNPTNLADLQGDTRHTFVKGDIGDRPLVARLLKQYRPRAAQPYVISPGGVPAVASAPAALAAWALATADRSQSPGQGSYTTRCSTTR